MAGLQRSEISFRRQGSSGSVWDDKFLAGALNQAKQNDQEEEQKAEAGEAKLSQSPAPISVMERSRSNGGQAYKTVKVAPAIDPPSPRVSGCGICGVFGKPVKSHHRPKRGKRKS
ncbi:MAPK kinase substrate protein At1g80180 [Vitis riparia]|uniref:MAPK kinase substrate protein At1g80180 n=1 Tax=Vitis riparia TaxID=96939 RepID=UPI00155A222D|nr:MAPK kinase substrate protein At1g80180 [Vitis riparia]